jgi:beta-galactosidase
LGVFRFHLDIQTANDTLTIPRQTGTEIALNGRDAKILTANYDFGSQYLLYSTSEIFTHIQQDSRDVMLVYAYEGEDGEFAITSGSQKVKAYGVDSNVTSSLSNNVLQINYQHPNGTAAISCSGNQGKELLLLVSGYSSAIKWWAPQTSKGETILVYGPYLVRSAEINGNHLTLTGDTDATTNIEIVVTSKVRHVTWNGVNVVVKSTSYGTLTAKIAGPQQNIQIPDLTKSVWKYSSASPETSNTFDDSQWLSADHMNTTSPFPPKTLPVLYADDYGTKLSGFEMCDNIY